MKAGFNSLFALLFWLVPGCVHDPGAESIDKVLINEPAKDFELTAIDGRAFRLSSLKGQVVWLNFWATWCGPCVQELPGLSAIYEKMKPLGLEILAVSIDKAADCGKVEPFAKKLNFNFPFFCDPGVGKLYGARLIPLNIIIDRQGRIRYRRSGFDNEIRLVQERVLRELMK